MLKKSREINAKTIRIKTMVEHDPEQDENRQQNGNDSSRFKSRQRCTH